MSHLRPAGTDRGPLHMGDLLVLLVSGTLAGVRDRLWEDGFDHAGELMAEVVEVLTDYVERRAAWSAD